MLKREVYQRKKGVSDDSYTKSRMGESESKGGLAVCVTAAVRVCCWQREQGEKEKERGATRNQSPSSITCNFFPSLLLLCSPACLGTT